VLLFDEADALFGKRSEVRDSHDRYANIEVSYLLQRVESYRGLAVLTTNARSALDAAFLRRIRFVVDFPFPGLVEREAIWDRAFPPPAPVSGIDPVALARLEVPGGVIRNIALRAAFLAADEGVAVGMGHLAVAARRECAKHGRSVPEAELRSWS
jgi:SpoVK/Ycf46/Vps4 family AAA+-type ATPase